MNAPAINLNGFTGTVINGPDELTARLGELEDRRIGLLGDPAALTGLLDAVARRATAVTVFQDRAVWVLPRFTSGPIPGAETAWRLLPVEVRRKVTKALASQHLRRRVRDPWTRRQLTPQHDPTRSTLVYSNSYHRALSRDNVRLVTWPVTRVAQSGVRTADGLEHRLDILINL